MSLKKCVRYSKVLQSYAFDRPRIARIRPSVKEALKMFTKITRSSFIHKPRICCFFELNSSSVIIP